MINYNRETHLACLSITVLLAYIKKFAPSSEARTFLGSFVWKITILRQKIIFFPIAEGGAKIFGVFRVKNHDFTPKNHIFSNFRGGGRAPGAPPLGSAPANVIFLFVLSVCQYLWIIKFLEWASQECVVFQLFRWLKTQMVELLIGFVCFCGLSLLNAPWSTVPLLLPLFGSVPTDLV